MDIVLPLISLSVMEIVLGVDNVIFIAILVERLPTSQQALARNLGLGLALVMRLGLLFTLTWMLGLTEPVFSLTQLGLPEHWLGIETNEVSWRDIILLVGGLFLIGKSVYEIHEKLEGSSEGRSGRAVASFGLVLAQIAALDIIFSLDSVITAVGMVGGTARPVATAAVEPGTSQLQAGGSAPGAPAHSATGSKVESGHDTMASELTQGQRIGIMVTAMVIACAVMLLFASRVSAFVHRHPTMKMLALSFLILIGVMLVADGVGRHIERGYLYFAMGFALLVEVLNLRLRRVSSPVELREPPPVRSAK
jgi:predicted tellurium resistance membrane protein TerC